MEEKEYSVFKMFDLKNIDIKSNINELKNNVWLSKKYLIIYIVLLLSFTLVRFEMWNYLHPKMEILTLILLSLVGIFCISYYNGHNDDKELYKTAFIIILIFGIICSFITPICLAPDEVEHFVRAEITSRGILFPEYINGSFDTIQSTLDLIEVGKMHFEGGFDAMNIWNSSIFHTTADTSPINHTLVEYPNAFAQNPFYGYLLPAIGILIAKLFNLNSIWLLWLGRIFNTLLYAGLVSIAIKKTPILKVPMLVFSCIPLSIFLGASVSIDAFINGIGILTVAYYFYLYKSPKNSLDYKNLIKYSILVFLIGTCKVSCFAFIFLLIFLPRENFKSDKQYLYGILCIFIMAIIALLWSRYYANPGFFKSYRLNKWAVDNVNSTDQLNYMLSHKKESLIEILHLPNYFNDDLTFRWNDFNSIYLLFLGAVSFLYPTEKFKIKPKIGALLVGMIFYAGTYIILLLTWTPIGELDPIIGVQQRYFLPMLPLIPFIFGFNHMDGDKTELNKYIIMLTVTFISFMLLWTITHIY